MILLPLAEILTKWWEKRKRTSRTKYWLLYFLLLCGIYHLTSYSISQSSHKVTHDINWLGKLRFPFTNWKGQWVFMHNNTLYCKDIMANKILSTIMHNNLLVYFCSLCDKIEISSVKKWILLDFSFLNF